MGSVSPIIVGGSGHSGTRIFNEILTLGGIFTGIRDVTKWRDSEDLKVINLLSRWVLPYIKDELSSSEMNEMRREFSWRLRLYFPVRWSPWGFKNPRTMLILPFLDEMFPNMKFVHVVRDGRDISLGNKFAGRNPYTDAFLREEEKNLSAEEKMILYWGRSNQRSMDYGRQQMQGRYILMRWEELCTVPEARARELLEFAGCRNADARKVAKIVKKPASIGRWKSFPQGIRDNVHARGAQWLSMFGYV